MATLTVWRFASSHGADAAEFTMRSLESEGLITIHDAAIVSWEWGADKPQTRQAHASVGRSAVSGSFWGGLFGVVFLMPVLGVAVGAGVGAVRSAMREAGIDDAFIDDVRAQVSPGTSALFVLSSDAVVDRVLEAFARTEVELISTNLSADQEAALREAFGA